MVDYGLSFIGTSTTPEVGVPSLGVDYGLSVTGTSTTPEVGVPSLVVGSGYGLSVIGTSTTPEVGIPEMTIYNQRVAPITTKLINKVVLQGQTPPCPLQ